MTPVPKTHRDAVDFKPVDWTGLYPPAMAASIRRKSGRFSDQKSASALSLSKSGTSSQLANVRISFRSHLRARPRFSMPGPRTNCYCESV